MPQIPGKYLRLLYSNMEPAGVEPASMLPVQAVASPRLQESHIGEGCADTSPEEFGGYFTLLVNMGAFDGSMPH